MIFLGVENREYYRLPGVGRPPPPKQFQTADNLPPKPESGNPGKSDYAETGSLVYPETGSVVFPPKPSYSSDYSDTSLDSGIDLLTTRYNLCIYNNSFSLPCQHCVPS